MSYLRHQALKASIPETGVRWNVHESQDELPMDTERLPLPAAPQHAGIFLAY